MDDREAIAALHAADEAASKAQDYDALLDLLDDEAVMLPPSGHMQRGKGAIQASFARLASTPPTHEMLDYHVDVEELQLLGDYALAWGTIRGRARNLSNRVSTESHYHFMRVLRKQADGAWKIYRSIWASAPLPRNPQSHSTNSNPTAPNG